MTNDINPGSKSADEVQREVRQSRAEVGDALEAIQDRLSPSQLFDQAVNYLRGSGGNEFMRNLGATVRDNPVPVALLGTGLAWLMLSSARPRRPYDEDEDRPDGYGADYYGAGDYPAGYPEGYNGFGDRPFGSEAAARAEPGLASDQGFVERAKETAAAAGATAQGLAEGAAELGRDWVTGARESAQEWSAGARATAGRVRTQARRAQARAGHHGRRLQRGFFDTLHEQPLVLGAAGLAVGAAIGAALPATETEDEWMGDTRDRLKDHASEAGREQLAKVGAAAGAAYDAAREEADRQGLTPEAAVAGAGSMAEKVERVAEAASDAANTEAQRQKLGQTEDQPV